MDARSSIARRNAQVRPQFCCIILPVGLLALALAAFCVVWQPGGGTGIEDRLLTVRAAELGAQWPLLEAEVRLACVPNGERIPGKVLVETGEGVFQLNEVKRQAGRELPRRLQRDDPDAPGKKLSLAPLIERGLALCR